jgi:hypothetical protein
LRAALATATNSRPPHQRRKSGGNIDMASIRPDDTNPMPLRASPHRMGTLMIRFFGLLFLTVAVLALLYSR